MRIKKHSNNNKYLSTDSGVWVRDFCTTAKRFEDINHLIPQKDFSVLLNNELENRKRRHPNIDNENVVMRNIVIVSDGYDFESKQEILADLPDDVFIIGTNKALKRWSLVGRKTMNYYVINNPYVDAMSFIPKKYFPTCIASSRTYLEFLKNYRGTKYTYFPVSEEGYSGLNMDSNYKIDDYRNPICAAIGLAYKFGVRKLALFCCDTSFKDNRPGAEKLENGFWAYPQQKLSHELIDGNSHWLSAQGVKICEHTNDYKFTNATYIKEEDIKRFFEDDNE